MLGRLMGSTSAIVAIGNMHQNDRSICPSHIAQLVEGSRSAWTLYSMGNDPVSPVVWRSDTPDRHLTSLLALIASHVLLDLQALENLDIEISQPVWSRIWSAWSNIWVVSP
jgi:hypothetical protein